MSIGRRDVIRSLAATVALPWLDGVDLLHLGTIVHAQSASSKGAALRVLDEAANRMVMVASECIIPATDTPGAQAAHVNRFIDHMLADWYPVEARDRFLAGIKELDAKAHHLYGRSFMDCSAADQTTVVKSFDDDVTALRHATTATTGGSENSPDDHWFAMLKFLTIWGYYTSEIGEQQELQRVALPMRYSGCAPYSPRSRPDPQP